MAASGAVVGISFTGNSLSALFIAHASSPFDARVDHNALRCAAVCCHDDFRACAVERGGIHTGNCAVCPKQASAMKTHTHVHHYADSLSFETTWTSDRNRNRNRNGNDNGNLNRNEIR